MHTKGKSKDNTQARLDLEVMNIRLELHPIRKGDKLELPVACYTLSKEEKHLFCTFLKKLRVPDGFSSNISQSVNMKEHKISSLKSHDCHVLLQHLLPLGIRGLLPKFGEAYQHDESFKFECNYATTSDAAGLDNWKRTDFDPMIVDIPATKKKRNHKADKINAYKRSKRSTQELSLPIRKTLLRWCMSYPCFYLHRLGVFLSMPCF